MRFKNEIFAQSIKYHNRNKQEDATYQKIVFCLFVKKKKKANSLFYFLKQGCIKSENTTIIF